MVLPIHDSNPTRRTPVVTYALIAVNVVAFLLSPVALATVGGSGSRRPGVQAAGLLRRPMPPSRASWCRTAPSTRWPPGRSARTPGGAPAASSDRPRPMRTSRCSPSSRRCSCTGDGCTCSGTCCSCSSSATTSRTGWGGCATSASTCSAGTRRRTASPWPTPRSTAPLIGASGAIAGVLGAYLVLYPRARVVSLVPFFFFIPLRLPAWLVLGGWFVLQYLYARGAAVTDAGGVAYLAHVVGFVVGAAARLAAAGGHGAAPDAAGEAPEAPRGPPPRLLNDHADAGPPGTGRDGPAAGAAATRRPRRRGPGRPRAARPAPRSRG